jgi:outer membrane protein
MTMSTKIHAGALCLLIFGMSAGIATAQIDTSSQSPVNPQSMQAAPGAKVLNLETAVKMALERNVQVIQARNRSDATGVGVTAAYGGLLPTVSANGGWSRQQQWQSTEGGVTLINGVPVTYPPGSSLNTYNNYTLGVGANWTLFDGMANISDIDRAKATDAAGKFNLGRTRQTVILQTHTLFMAVARVYQLLGVANDNLSRSRRQLERITESNKVGAVALADVYRQQVQVGNDELALIQAQTSLATAKADLIAWLGVEYDERGWAIDVTGQPTDIDTADFTEVNNRYSNFDTLVAMGVKQRPDQRATLEAYNAASSAVTIAQSGYWPSLAGSASYGYSSSRFGNLIAGGIDNPNGDKNLSLSLRLSVPIFNGFSTMNQVEQAQVQEMNAKEDLEQAKRQIAVDVRKALLTLGQSEKRLIVSRTSVVSADMDRKIAEEKYNLGAGTLLDLLVATASYTNAVQVKVDAVFDFLLAKKSVEYALGILTY